MGKQMQPEHHHRAGTALYAHVPRLPVFALGASLSLFLVITFVLCVAFDLLFPSHAMYTAWEPYFPGFAWLTWQTFLVGLLESFAYGWYVALIFGPLFNFFVRRWK